MNIKQLIEKLEELRVLYGDEINVESFDPETEDWSEPLPVPYWLGIADTKTSLPIGILL